MRCVLIGNYGVKNIGDEALKAYFLHAFPTVDWTIVSAMPEGDNEVPRLPLGFHSFLKPWWKTLRAIAAADVVVFGGGSLFTDSESVLACALWWWHAIVARFFGKPFFLAFQGIGPFQTSLGAWFARSAFKRAAFISVRDTASLRRVQSWNLGAIPSLTFDPVFGFFLLKKPSTHSLQNVLTIIPRGRSNDAFFREVSEASRRSFDELRIVLMQPTHLERSIAEKIKMVTKRASIVPLHSLEQLLEEISISSQVIAQRYHGALAALALGIPVTIVPQVGGDKLDELRLLGSTPLALEHARSLVAQGEAAMAEALRTTVHSPV